MLSRKRTNSSQPQPGAARAVVTDPPTDVPPPADNTGSSYFTFKRFNKNKLHKFSTSSVSSLEGSDPPPRSSSSNSNPNTTNGMRSLYSHPSANSSTSSVASNILKSKSKRFSRSVEDLSLLSSFSSATQPTPSKSNVLYQGLLQRQVSTHPWKIYVVTLKGSKLYLYKLPPDFTGPASQLFSPSGRGPEPTLKWLDPFRTHPELAITDGAIRGGSLEALIHELLFATRQPETVFMLAVLYVLAVNVSTLLPEAENIATHYFRIAEETQGEDGTGQDDAYDVNPHDTPTQVPPASRYTQGLSAHPNHLISEVGARIATLIDLSRSYSLLAALRPLFANLITALQDIVAPENGALHVLLTENRQKLNSASLSVLAAEIGSPARTMLSHSSSMSLADPSSRLLSSRPREYAQKINSHYLAQYAELMLPSPQFLQKLFEYSVSKRPSPVSLFSFSTAALPPLAQTVLQSILVPSSLLDTRSTILARWIEIGSELLKLNNYPAFVAIAIAVCSRAVARLTHTWSRVGYDLETTVRRDWVPLLMRIEYEDKQGATKLLPLDVAADDENAPRLLFLGSIADNLAHYYTTRAAPYSLAPIYDTIATVSSLAIPAAPEAEGSTVDAGIDTPHTDDAALASYLALSYETEPPLLHTQLDQRGDFSLLVPFAIVDPLPIITLIEKKDILSKNRALSRRQSYPPSKVDLFSQIRRDISTTLDTSSDPSLICFAGGNIVFRAIYEQEDDTASTAAPQSRASSWLESKSVRNSRRFSLRSSSGASTMTPRMSMSMSLSKPLSASSVQRLSQVLATKSFALDSGPESISHSDVESNIGHENSGEYSDGPSLDPMRVIVHSGSIDSLLDLSIVGTYNLRTEDGRALYLDMEEYRLSFYSSYKAFASPCTVFQLLKTRYLSAVEASKEFLFLTSEKPFPSWREVPNSANVDVSWPTVNWIRWEILQNFSHWCLNHVFDFLDDEKLILAISEFLDEIESKEKSRLEEEKDASHESVDDKILQEILLLKSRFAVQCLRPNIGLKPTFNFSSSPSLVESNAIAYDDVTASELVTALDKLASRATVEVTADDLMRYTRLVEQSIRLDPAKYCASADEEMLPSTRELLPIQDTYSHLFSIKPTSEFARAVPPSLHHLVRVHSVMTNWVSAHLADPGISFEKRIERMTKAIDAIAIARARMFNVSFGGQSERKTSLWEPSLVSFIERAMCAAILSPESRLYSQAWRQLVGSDASVDSLAALFRDKPLPSASETAVTSTLDYGWLIERTLELMLSIGEYANDTSSIAFYKRRWIYNCIQNAVDIRPCYSGSEPSILLLNNIEQNMIGWGSWPFKMMREAAATENINSAPVFDSLVSQQLDKYHQDRRFARQYLMQKNSSASRYDYPSRSTVAFPPSQSQMLSTTSGITAQNTRLPSHSSNSSIKSMGIPIGISSHISSRTRRVTSLFRSSARPAPDTASLSTVNTPTTPSMSVQMPSSTSLSSVASSTGTNTSPRSELKSIIGHATAGNAKPSLVIVLSGVVIRTSHDANRPFVFELRTDDGQCSLFQAPSGAEFDQWLKYIQQRANEMDSRRATFMAQTALVEEDGEVSTPEPVDFTLKVPSTYSNNSSRKLISTRSNPAAASFASLLSFQSSSSLTKSKSNQPMFGLPLEDLCLREGTEIPFFIEKTLTEVEKRGINEVGIYRISGENKVINDMRHALNRSSISKKQITSLVTKADVHNLTGLVKMYLRDLPQPLIPYECFDPLVETNNLTDPRARLGAVQDILRRIPHYNYTLLVRLMQHLDRIAINESKNSMHAANLAIVFSPTLMRPDPASSSGFGIAMMASLGKCANVVKHLITGQDAIFSEELIASSGPHATANGLSDPFGALSISASTTASYLSAPPQPTGTDDLNLTASPLVPTSFSAQNSPSMSRPNRGSMMITHIPSNSSLPSPLNLKYSNLEEEAEEDEGAKDSDLVFESDEEELLPSPTHRVAHQRQTSNINNSSPISTKTFYSSTSSNNLSPSNSDRIPLSNDSHSTSNASSAMLPLQLPLPFSTPFGPLDARSKH